MSEVPIMVMPWHRPDPCKPLKNQTDAAFKSTYIDYLSSLSIDSTPLAASLTGVMCTIGPSSKSVDTIMDLMQSGMTLALIPLSLGVRQEHIDTVANLRTANTAFSHTLGRVYPLAIAVQTKGPGLRIGGLKKRLATDNYMRLPLRIHPITREFRSKNYEAVKKKAPCYDIPIDLPLHHKVCLTTDKTWRVKGTEHYLYIGFPEMCHVLSVGDVLLVGGGVVILQVEVVEDKEVVCLVVGGGRVHSFMPVSAPDIPLRLPPLTDEDADDLRMAASLGVDIVVATRTQNVNHVREVRKILEECDKGSGIKVWAQIESKLALENMESILEEADAILLSRVSLTQDLPPEKLFLAQKKVLASCNKMGVPVFISSHFLPSMQADVNPSIAELADVAAAVLDGADGFVLRNTTSIGRNPEHTVRTLVNACLEAEAATWHYQTFSTLSSLTPPPIDPTHAIAISAIDAAMKSSASAIFMATTSGRSAQLVSRYRPRCPVIAITRYGQVARQLNAYRAVIPLHYVEAPLPDWPREVDVRLQFGIEFAKQQGIVVPGDCLVLLNGWRLGAGFTNTIRIVYASDSFPWVYPHQVPSIIPSDQDVDEATQGVPPNKVPVDATSKSSASEAPPAIGIKKTLTAEPEVILGDPPMTVSPSRTSRLTLSRLSRSRIKSDVAIKAMEEELKTITAKKSREFLKRSLLDEVETTKQDFLIEPVPNQDETVTPNRDSRTASDDLEEKVISNVYDEQSKDGASEKGND